MRKTNVVNPNAEQNVLPCINHCIGIMVGWSADPLNVHHDGEWVHFNVRVKAKTLDGMMLPLHFSSAALLAAPWSRLHVSNVSSLTVCHDRYVVDRAGFLHPTRCLHRTAILSHGQSPRLSCVLLLQLGWTQPFDSLHWIVTWQQISAWFSVVILVLSQLRNSYYGVNEDIHQHACKRLRCGVWQAAHNSCLSSFLCWLTKRIIRKSVSANLAILVVMTFPNE